MELNSEGQDAPTGRVRLPCRRSVTQLWALIEEGPDGSTADPALRRLQDHSRSCRYCGPELDRLRRLRSTTEELRLAAPTSPETLLSRVMSVVRNEFRSGPDLRLIEHDERATVSSLAVVRVVRRALTGAGGARPGRITIAEEAGYGIVVAARVSVPGPADRDDTEWQQSERLRLATLVGDAVQGSVGIPVHRVDLELLPTESDEQ